MSNTITSPVAEFPGTLVLRAPLNLEQCHRIAVALETASAKGAEAEREDRRYASNQETLRALIACVEKWEIQGQPEAPTLETFNASPVVPVQRFLTWALGELIDIYFGELTVPNE